ncbi:zinc finger BED domain-containing protein RICESLEEPER 2-like [Papaver somniferum]|uniref:zinc finger BED domain-containing protein RICESLEEPER 2-like n=1 Tax=Papaver somniferum TaxID=3469 RepID=UPI000E6F6343|nr:zinc finger BED domain-containing protein RICESLEEPER 2-like [Papaver somniferum]
MFGDDKAAELYEKFKTDLFKVFNAYESQNSTAAPAFFSNSVAHMDVRSSGASSTDYASFVLENDEDDVQKSELETYLGEPILPTLTTQDEMNFDILVWWKMNSCKYPTLANIARDVLAMPVTSVASESMFSDGGTVLTTHRTSLSPDLVQAFLCLSDWLPDFFDADMEIVD